jgi:mono/diheme cytochrome c family protein
MSIARKRVPALLLIPLFMAGVCIPLALKAAQQKNEAAVSKGQQLYSQYCRSCHGDTAAGDGPAATALKVRPADLTRIARNHKGFPTEKVMDWIDGEKYAIGHGSREMPVWGKRFRRSASADAGSASEITALTKYLESIQQK